MRNGQRLQIRVVEPYEFELPEGGTTLSGLVLQIGVWPPTLPCAIVELDRDVTWEGATGSHLLLTPRYEGGVLDEVAGEKGLTVNMNLLPKTVLDHTRRFISGGGGDFPGRVYGGHLPEFIAILKVEQQS